ncbi:MAG: InlB B-repeat-containing protein [Bacteroidota bacterium]
MKKLLLLFGLTSLCTLTSVAQISQPATPPGFALKEGTASVPFIKIMALEIQQLIEEDEAFDTIPAIPWRFGENIEVDISPDDSGVWKELGNGDKLWQLGISSPGAITLNLSFNKYVLPPNAQLFIYSADKNHVLGAFTDYNNQDDQYFATSLVEGDSIIVEYYEPKDVDFPGELNICTVTHAYRNAFDYVKGFGNSGSCNLNVACSEADEWQDQVNSTVMLLTGANAFCSGAIINNVNEDFTPYLLTANHCYKDPATVVVWFNWQSDECNNPPSAPEYDAMSGSTTKARDSNTDFWLLELNQPIPEEYNAFFAGWNRTLEPSLDESIISVHHPKGDIKKFSYALDGVNQADYLGAEDSGDTHWRIVWSGGTTTEPGSSGSPLFDSQGRIIGQLHGGYAACGNTHPDWYGILGVSWTGNETNQTRLSSWLDPDNLDVPYIPGIYYSSDEIKDPYRFKTTALNDSNVMITWKSNPNDNNILVAYNTENSFGIPSGPYSIGDEIEGGGTILHMSNNESFFHQDLDYNTQYYYKAWSFNNILEYSQGVESEAKTFCYSIFNLPYTELFESELLSSCWEQDVISGNSNWQIASGNGEGMPSNAYSGDYNLLFKSEDLNNTSKIILPDVYFNEFDYGTLSFYYTNAASDKQDTLKVYIRNYESTDWVLLETFMADVNDWTYAEIPLSEVFKVSQIAFEATANGSLGICIDNISISGDYNADFPAPVNLAVSSIDDHSALLSWDVPIVEKHSPEIQAYKIYRNDTFTGITSSINEITLTGLPVGTHEYSVSAIYKNPYAESETSEAVSFEIDSTNLVQVNIETEGNGSITPFEGNYVFNSGAFITLSAIADESWSFSHYELNSEIVSVFPTEKFYIDDDIVLKAVFNESEYFIGHSSVPGGISNLTGEGLYAHGEIAEISTDIPEGYYFLYWKDGDNIISTNTNVEVAAFTDIELVAHFEIKQYNVKLLANPYNAGVVDGDGLFDYGTEITVNATANDNWHFVYWKDNGEIVSDKSEFTFSVNKEHMMVAVFDVGSSNSSEQMSDENIVVSPNPASDFINVELSIVNSEVKLELYNISGQKVLAKTIRNNYENHSVHKIDLKGLKQGVYVLKLSNNKKVHNFKILKY